MMTISITFFNRPKVLKYLNEKFILTSIDGESQPKARYFYHSESNSHLRFSDNLLKTDNFDLAVEIVREAKDFILHIGAIDLKFDISDYKELPIVDFSEFDELLGENLYDMSLDFIAGRIAITLSFGSIPPHIFLRLVDLLNNKIQEVKKIIAKMKLEKG